MKTTMMLMTRGVGVGYHHPPTQWPNTPMGAHKGGNSSAVASPTTPCILELLFPWCFGSGTH
eukprot:9206806-Karenia_brevis.AAC.1